MIIVTGGTGFLGSHLICRLLQRGLLVKGLKRGSSSLEHFEKVYRYYFPDPQPGATLVEWVDCDVTDISGLQDCIEEGDWVYHCAAQVHFNAGHNSQLFQVNVNGTANIVDVCLEKNVRKLVHVSSIGALGDSLDGQAVDECTPRKLSVTQSAYSTSKYLGELEVFRGIAEGLPAVIVNPSVIIGPCDDGMGISALVEMVRGGLKYYPAGANAWVDVRDVAEAMILLMEGDPQGERFILSAENRSYQYVLEQIAEHLKMKKPEKKATKNLLKLAAAAFEIRKMLTRKPNPLTRDLIRISSSVTEYSAEKFLKATGFHFIPVSQSLKDTCRPLF